MWINLCVLTFGQLACIIITMNIIPWKTSKHALAYVLGSYLSDGCTDYRVGAFRLAVNDKAFAFTVADALVRLGIPHRVSPQRAVSGFTGKVFTRWLVCEHVRGREIRLGDWCEQVTSNKEELPSMPTEVFPEVVAGAMDGDGSISHSSHQWNLSLSGTRTYILDLANTLETWGVKVSYPRPPNIGYRINLPSFIDAGFFFRMPRKQFLLWEYVIGRAGGWKNRRIQAKWQKLENELSLTSP